MTLDAPQATQLDSVWASPLDARGLSAAVMRVVHIVWIDECVPVGGEPAYRDRGNNGADGLAVWNADVARYLDAYATFVQGQPWGFTQIVYWVNPGGETGYAILPIALTPVDLPPEIGTVPFTPYSRDPTVAGIWAVIGRYAAHPWRVYHTIDTSGSMSRTTIDPGFSEWIAEASQIGTGPVSREDFVSRDRGERWVGWGIEPMRQLPGFYQEWLQSQP